MSANVRIVHVNDHDAATLSVSSPAATGFPIEYTQNARRGKVWKTTSNAGQSFTGVWPETRTVSHFSMHRHLNHAGSVRFQLFSDAGATTQVYDSTALSCAPWTPTETYFDSLGRNDPFQYLYPYDLWFAETAARSYKVTFSGTPAQSYWQIARVCVGRYFELAVNPDYGFQLGWQDQTENGRSRGGSLFTNKGDLWRTLIGNLNSVAATELGTWADAYVQAGTAQDVMISPFPDDTTRKRPLHTMMARFMSLDVLGHEVSRFTKAIKFEEF